MEEIWKSIEGFEGLYEVSNLGNVKALERFVENNHGMQKKHEKILKQNQANGRHSMVVLCKEGKTYPKLVHRLVAIAFIPNPDDKPVVDHIDTNPQNNCVDNLRWATISENCMNPLTRVHNSDSKKGHQYYRKEPLSKESREKISNKLKGIKFSDERKARLSESMLSSEKFIENSRNNIKKAQAANIGKHHSPETIAKLKVKAIGRHKGQHWKIIDGKRIWY